jgi:DNA-binding NtrC family response regulator
MNRPQELVCWFGQHDLWAMAADVSGAVAKTVHSHPRVGQSRAHPDRGSPVKILVDHQPFKRVHLLSNYDDSLERPFVEWLGHDAEVHRVPLANPDSYWEVFEATDSLLAAVHRDCNRRGTSIAIHLGPGTKAMTAVLLLLGCAKYSASFYQTHDSKAWEERLPFELSLYLQEQFRAADKAWTSAQCIMPTDAAGFEGIVGESPAIGRAVFLARRAAMRNVSVLLLGESGVGKELFARAIHRASGRKGKFCAVNCAAIPRDLLEAELFGSVKHAGTNTAERVGLFAEAHEGTLFLDEVGEMPADHQAKLLRALQSSEESDSPTRLSIERVGEGGKPRTYDVRIVAATNKDLLSPPPESPFRSDLYYRLATFPITLPPLRDRSGDMVIIADRILERLNKQNAKAEPGYQPRSLSKDAVKRLVQHDWPGNVRELASVLARATILSDRTTLERDDIEMALPRLAAPGRRTISVPAGDRDLSLAETLVCIEKQLVEAAMTECDGVQRRAAELVGDNVTTFNKRVHRLGIAVPAARRRDG